MYSKILFCCMLSIACSVLAMGQISFNLPPSASAANINRLEYFFDTDPGFGSGTSISFSAGTDITASSVSLNIGALTNGIHRLYVRSQDNNGNWSLTNYQNLFIVPTFSFPVNASAINVTKLEYFFDTDPGFGNGTNIAVTPGTDVTASSVAVDISSLTPGIHRLYVRSRDANGSWSLTNVQSLFVLFANAAFPPNPAATNVTALEYFVDTDPGFGKAHAVSITPGTDITSSLIPIDITGLSNGTHRVYFRTLDANGSWGLTNLQIFQIVVTTISFPPNPTPENITMFEWFVDTDPGFGHGNIVTVPAGTDISNFTFAADITGLAMGVHHFFIRSFDGWSVTTVKGLGVGVSLPVTWLSFTARKTADDKVQLTWQTAAEVKNDHFEIERSTDGSQFKTIGTVQGSKNSNTIQTYTYTDNTVQAGSIWYRIKQVDVDGLYSYSAVVSVQLSDKSLFDVINNPVKDMLNIYLSPVFAQNTSIRIIDISGKELKKIEGVQAGTLGVNVSGLAAGTYIVQCLHNGVSYNKRFVKE
jgi:hypothetical protein